MRENPVQPQGGRRCTTFSRRMARRSSVGRHPFRRRWPRASMCLACVLGRGHLALQRVLLAQVGTDELLPDLVRADIALQPRRHGACREAPQTLPGIGWKAWLGHTMSRTG
jgi:hypothetical protein